MKTSTLQIRRTIRTLKDVNLFLLGGVGSCIVLLVLGIILGIKALIIVGGLGALLLSSIMLIIGCNIMILKAHIKSIKKKMFIQESLDKIYNTP